MAQAELYASKLQLRIVAGQETAGSYAKLRAECLGCGRLMEKSCASLRDGKGCWWCGKRRAASKQQLMEETLVEACANIA
jgi:hypothetical protein